MSPCISCIPVHGIADPFPFFSISISQLPKCHKCPIFPVPIFFFLVKCIAIGGVIRYSFSPLLSFGHRFWRPYVVCPGGQLIFFKSPVIISNIQFAFQVFKGFYWRARAGKNWRGKVRPRALLTHKVFSLKMVTIVTNLCPIYAAQIQNILMQRLYVFRLQKNPYFLRWRKCISGPCKGVDAKLKSNVFSDIRRIVR